jgi:glycosyltransferase involved in cell wall biosynthesis
MSEANRQYVISHYKWVDSSKIVIFPNTKCIRYNKQRHTDFIMRRKYNIPENAVVAVFGGNMGRPQGLEFLMKIMSRCNGRNDIFFLLIGRGTEHSKVAGHISKEGLGNALILKSLPREDYELMLTECDIGLIFLDKRFTIPNFPSRILSYFEYEMPVLAATDINTDFSKMVEKSGAGFWVPAGDIDEYIRYLDIMISDSGLRHSMGLAGRRYLEQNYDVRISAELLEKRFIE